MKKTLIVIITVLCFTVLFGSCKSEENEQPPSNETGAGKDTKRDKNSGSDPKNTAKPDDKIQTGQPAADGTVPKEGGSNPEADTPQFSPPTSVTDDESYYTILNTSDDSNLEIHFLDSTGNFRSIVRTEGDCVEVTNVQFQNNITKIIHLLDTGRETFCGLCAGCEQCVSGNYELLEGYWWWSDDYITQVDRPNSEVSCIPLFEL